MAILPEEVFKRRQRHNNTPESTLLIIANFIVVAVDESLFVTHKHVAWFFWVVLAFLALYNFFTIRRHREEFTKVDVIAFAISIAVLIATFFLILYKGA